VQLLRADGYDAEGIDISPEQVALARRAGVHQVREGDYRTILAEQSGRLIAVVATDLLEHLTKEEVLDAFDRVTAALAPGGVFIARVPNAVSPFGGHIRYGDFTHESWFTKNSIRQLATISGLESVAVMPCAPLPHGLMSTGRWLIWKTITLLYKIALGAETGVLRGHIVTQNLIFSARKPKSTAVSRSSQTKRAE
jgi:trans-aconitate methyltransferase